MKISVLETNMLTNGDISLSSLEALGDVDFYNKLDDGEIVRLCSDSDIILCTKTIFHKELIDSLPTLKLICVFATGYNNIDVKYAREKGIAVANAPAYSTESVVQHVFALLLNLAGNTHRYIESTFCGEWIKSPTFSYFNIPITEIFGKTIGIVGYGAIGRRIAEVATAFGMRVLISTRTHKEDCPYPQLTVDEMLPLCDFDKKKVRSIAESENISVSGKKDSQEICFLPDGRYAEYIESVKGPCPEGNFVDADGRILGKHKGIIHYTVGQRKGLGIALGARAFVTEICPQTNEITLEYSMKGKEEIRLSDVVFCGIQPPNEVGVTLELPVKLRYTAPLVTAKCELFNDGTAILKFENSVIAAPGQSAVAYIDDMVAFGGYINN